MTSNTPTMNDECRSGDTENPTIGTTTVAEQADYSRYLEEDERKMMAEELSFYSAVENEHGDDDIWGLLSGVCGNIFEWYVLLVAVVIILWHLLLDSVSLHPYNNIIILLLRLSNNY